MPTLLHPILPLTKSYVFNFQSLNNNSQNWLGFCVLFFSRQFHGTDNFEDYGTLGECPVEREKPGVLICDGCETDRNRIYELLRSEYPVTLTSKISEALTLMQRGVYTLILLSVSFEERNQELNIIQAINILKKIDPDLIIIIMASDEGYEETDFRELEKEIRTKEIFYYILKPIDEEELKKVVKLAFNRSRATK